MNEDPTLATLGYRLTEVRDSLGDEHMTIPVSEIFGRVRRRRARRWLMAAGAACAATGAAVAMILAPGSSPAPQVHTQLAAWTVHPNRDGTVTFTLRNTSHPAQLQHALARAGVPAVIRWEEICLAGGKGQPLINTDGFAASGPAPGQGSGAVSYFTLDGGYDPHPDLNWSWIITPSKIPPGGNFVISAVPLPVPAGDIRIAWEFAHTSAPLTCARHMKD